MTMYLRLHRGQYVDAVIPSAVGVAPSPAPTDIVLSFQSDINPSKTIQVTENVQATDPKTGALLYNTDGTPKWETTTVTNPDGSKTTQIVTQQVSKTVYLLDNPTIFTESDLPTGYVVVGSLDEAKQNKKAELLQAFETALINGFTSSADGTSRTYSLDSLAFARINGCLSIVNAGKGQASQPWYTKDGTQVSFTPTQFVQFAVDAFTFYNTQDSNLKTKEANAESATTHDAVTAVAY